MLGFVAVLSALGVVAAQARGGIAQSQMLRRRTAAVRAVNSMPRPACTPATGVSAQEQAVVNLGKMIRGKLANAKSCLASQQPGDACEAGQKNVMQPFIPRRRRSPTAATRKTCKAREGSCRQHLHA